jgi:mono/diheme cytochrome c family protein
MSKRWLLAAGPLAALAGLWPAAARAEGPAPARDIGAEVRSVFEAKCAGCHGPHLAKPRGRFGYVLDLRRVAGNPELVIPQRPAESELWELVQRDEMPPADSPAGALTHAQKEIIREWIAAGAPDALPRAAEGEPEATSGPTAPAATALSPAARLVRWLGKFHLLLLHFPIALVLAAGFGEAASAWHRNPRPSGAVRFCLGLAALAAVPTAGLGWLFAAAGNGSGSPQLLTAHRWLGTAAAAWLLLAAACAGRDARRKVRSRRFRLLLATGILLTVLAAHFGGLLAHGEDFFVY